MKKRSLALFLAFLMVFSAVLPVFATEPEISGGDTQEKQETTLTYEDLYVEDPVFAWDAFGKTTEDTVDFGEESSVVLGTYGDKSLKITKPTKEGSYVIYGDGYLEVKDTGSVVSLSISNAYDKLPSVSGITVDDYKAGDYTATTQAYTTQMTMALLPYVGDHLSAGTPKAVGTQDAIPFSSYYGYDLLLSYGMKESVTFVDEAAIKLLNDWSADYLAAKNDASLQASFRTPIGKTEYNKYVAMDEYKDHVFVVNGTDEDLTNDPCDDYSKTGYEADYKAFTKILADHSAKYNMINYNQTTNPDLYKFGIAKTTVNASTWAADCDWKNNSRLWLTKDEGEVMTQTRINSVTAPGCVCVLDKGKETEREVVGFSSVTSAYVDQTASIKENKKTGATAPTAKFQFGTGADARYYSIRIYEGELSALQMAQNHFADLCGYYAIDLAPLATLLAENEDLREVILGGIYNASTTLTIGKTDADAVSALITEAADSIAAKKNQAAYDAMYVTKDLMYRWDAYDLNSVSGSTLLMPDKNGGDTVLTLNNVSYNATYKVPETTNPYDFSALISRTNGVYDETELEYELVMTQTSYNGTEHGDNRPHLTLGPMNTLGSGAMMSKENQAKTDAGKAIVHTNIPSYGGYAAYYFGYRSLNPVNHSDPAKCNPISVTYYFDATGARVDAAVDGGNEVTVKYPGTTTGVQICTQDWGAFARYFGNYVGQSYSVGGQITFDAANYKMGLSLIRDTKVTSKGVYNNISYIPGYASSTIGTKIVPENYEEALKMADRNFTLNSTEYGTDNGTFQIAGVKSSNVKVGYYAFRLYNRHLTDAERAQNHFADLCNYYKISNVDLYNALSQESKDALHAKFATALIDSRDEATNISFDDVTKAELDKAIVDQAAAAEELAKIQIYYDMYVDGATTLWSAYFKADGAAESDSTLSIAGGEAAYSNGYLRAAGSTLTVSNAYAVPSNGKTANYTTELIYASYNDGKPLSSYTGDVQFETEFGVIFGNKVSGVFKTLATAEDITYTDVAGRALQEAWASAYVAAENDDALKAAFWTPISKTDYDTLVAAGQDANVRKVGGDTGIKPIGDYSKTGYEANWEGFQYVLTVPVYTSSNGTTYTGRTNFYHGYNFSTATKPGIGNSNIMKSDINVGGTWAANLDFEDWATANEAKPGNWSRQDFGVITNHTWVENVSYDGKISATTTAYGDGTKIYSKTKADRTEANAKLSANFEIKAFDADYYAIRIYPFVLTEEQVAQNHFADLASFVKIDNVEAFATISEGGKQALYAAFADTAMDSDPEAKAALKTALETAIQETADKEAAFAALGVSAEDFFAFEGYQMSIWTKPAMRANFSVKTPAADGIVLKEIGMGMAFGGSDPMITYVYDGIGYQNTKTDGENTYATLEISFTTAAEQTKAVLTAEFNFSAYVVISYEGIEYRMECDMTSETFGEGVSIYELATHPALAELENAKFVRSIVEAE